VRKAQRDDAVAREDYLEASELTSELTGLESDLKLATQVEGASIVLAAGPAVGLEEGGGVLVLEQAEAEHRMTVHRHEIEAVRAALTLAETELLELKASQTCLLEGLGAASTALREQKEKREEANQLVSTLREQVSGVETRCLQLEADAKMWKGSAEKAVENETILRERAENFQEDSRNAKQNSQQLRISLKEARDELEIAKKEATEHAVKIETLTNELAMESMNGMGLQEARFTPPYYHKLTHNPRLSSPLLGSSLHRSQRL